MVEVAIQSSVPQLESGQESRLDPFNHEDVLRKLPEVIRRIAYSIRHLPRCCDLLWELGRDDDRKLNPYPDHAMRVLTDLAGYDPDKHLAYNQVVLNAIARWLEAPDAHTHLHSPLDVLDPMLAKTGTSVHGHHHVVRIRSFHCTKEWTQSIQDEALKLVEKCLDSEQTKVILRALQSLDEALREPTPYLNMSLSKEERAQWTPDRLRMLSILEDFAQRSSHPIILTRVQEILRVAATYGSSDEVKQKARSMVSAIPDSFDLRLTRLLCRKHHDLCFPDDEDDDDLKIPWQERQDRINRLGAAVAVEFLQAHPEPEDGFQNLNDRFRAMTEIGKEVHPWLVLHAISEANGAYSDALCELVLASPDCPLASTFGLLVAKLRRRNEKAAISLIRRALQGGNVVLCRAVAREYWQQGWLAEPRPEDLATIEHIISHTDFGVRRLGITALPALAKSQPRAPIAIAMKLDIGDSDKLADELCAAFTRQEDGIDANQLTDAELTGILAKLEPVQRIDGHFVHQFLASASRRSPEAVIQFFLNRIEAEESRWGEHGRALPFDGFHFRLEGVAESAKYQDFLRSIRDRMLGAKGAHRFWLPKLFKKISLDFSPTSLEVLREWIDSGDPEKIMAAASIVSEANPGFVFEHVGFVMNLLDRALQGGNTCHRRVSNCVYNCARSGPRQGVSGQPFPQDFALCNRAKEMAASLPAGTPVHRLFESLQKYAEAEIHDQIARDEELDD